MSDIRQHMAHNWISVEDALPDRFAMVLLYPDGLRDCRVTIGCYMGDGEWEDTYCDVSRSAYKPTHWHPMIPPRIKP